MTSNFSTSSHRGTGWVVMQFAILFVLLAAGPICPAQWFSWWTWMLGFVLLAVGVWAGIRGHRDLGKHLTPFPRPKEDAQLVTHGIYAHVRHPLYLFLIATGFSWALFWRSKPALVLALLQIPFFYLKARQEERWLRERFPEYDGYAKRVKRFIPGLF